MEGWLPFLATLAAVGIVASLAQTRGLVAFRRLQPSLERINPWAGLRRVFSARGLFETAKGLVKMAILGIILYQSLRALPGRLALASQAGLGPGLAVLGDALSRIAKQGAALLVLAASADYVYQWRQYRQRIKMTREEVMEELKNAEGQPFIKAKIRQLQRRWSRQRMMAQLVRADVVVTNPTHVAVALRYDRATMLAPIVVAKGKGLIAEQIMRKARELGIPLVQNIPLAHALIRVELGEQIPVNLYRAVAEVLAFVYRLRKEGRA
jgi:flagellar biosynthetic protein FlhB